MSRVQMYADAVAGVDDYGLLVGTGDTPTSMDDYALENLIIHGSGDGYLYYNASAIATPTVSGDVTSMVISRAFTNNGSTTVTVKEVALAVRTERLSASNSYQYVMISRDVLDTPLEIAPGETKTVEIIMRVTA